MKLLSRAIIIVLGFSSLCYCQEKPSLPEREIYLGLLLPNVGLNSDFSGDKAFIGSYGGHTVDFVTTVPRIDRSFGWGGTLGFKKYVDPQFAIGAEANYIQTKHDTRWLDLNDTATYQNFSTDFKAYFNASQKIQPVARLGIGFNTLSLKKGYIDQNSTKKISYLGMNFNLGFGVAYYPNDKWGFQFTTIYRPTKFNRIDLDGVRELPEDLKSNSVDFEFGVVRRFVIGKKS
ncbi:MAG: outer membrane beta-barrel protein [Elusimicrobiota bacterium]